MASSGTLAGGPSKTTACCGLPSAKSSCLPSPGVHQLPDQVGPDPAVISGQILLINPVRSKQTLWPRTLDIIFPGKYPKYLIFFTG